MNSNGYGRYDIKGFGLGNTDSTFPMTGNTERKAKLFQGKGVEPEVPVSQQVEIPNDELVVQSGDQERMQDRHPDCEVGSGQWVFTSCDHVTFCCTLIRLRHLTCCIQVPSNNQWKSPPSPFQTYCGLVYFKKNPHTGEQSSWARFRISRGHWTVSETMLFSDHSLFLKEP